MLHQKIKALVTLYESYLKNKNELVRSELRKALLECQAMVGFKISYLMNGEESESTKEEDRYLYTMEEIKAVNKALLPIIKCSVPAEVNNNIVLIKGAKTPNAPFSKEVQ